MIDAFDLGGDPWRVVVGSLRTLLGVVAVAWASHRWSGHLARRMGSRRPLDRADHLTLTLLLALAFVVTSTAALALTGTLTTFAVALVALLYGVSGLLSRPGPAPGSPWGPKGAPRSVRIALLLVVLLGAIDLSAQLPRVPSNWDAMGYHLHYPARWLQAEGFEAVPTVFGDAAAEFSPHNGGLLFAWQMALLGFDTTTNVCQWLAVALLALGLFRLGRELGVGATASALVACWPFLLAPVRRWTYSANVDVLMLAFALVAFPYLLRYRRSRSRLDLGIAALGGGLAAGTKMLGLPLAGSVGLVVALSLGLRRRFGDLAFYLVTTFAVGGWWFLHTAWRTGNPVFPLQVELGPWTLGGVYDRRGLMGSEFHIAAFSDLVDWTLGRLGLPTLVLALAGLLALLASVGSRGKVPRAASARVWTLAYALGWGFYFLTSIPHNNQSRFLLPTLLLALVGWAWVLEVLARAGAPPTRRGPGRLALTVWASITLALLLDSRPWQDWGEAFDALSASGAAAESWGLFCGLVTAWLLRWGWHALEARRPAPPLQRGRSALALGLATLGLTASVFLSEQSRSTVLAEADFRRWSEGYAPFLDPALPPLRVAYTGVTVPYVLSGPGWRHHVRYVNTQGDLDDGFLDFWRRDPKLHPHHKPPLYRGADRLDDWLTHLDRAEIDVVAIFTLHPVERKLIPTTTEGFPIEQVWARGRPDRFVPLNLSSQAEIYRYVPRGESP